MILSVALIVTGILLSAFFSGSETGFYRVTRVRLVMDAKTGSLISRSLLWMVGHPSVVVATVLIGNNIANYIVSLGLVLIGQQVLASWGEQLQTFLPVLATPFLFIYGELLPKYLYYHAPYFLSTRGAPVMVLCAVLFLPISIVVIGLEWLWQRLGGTENVRTKLSLERQELQRALMEGQEAGLLQPIQREVSQNLFTYGVRPVRHFTIPLRAMSVVAADASAEEVLAQAKRFKQNTVGVLAPDGSDWVGCYQVADLVIFKENAPLLPVGRAVADESNIQVLTRLQSQQSPVAQVVDAHGVTIGIVSRDRLMSLLVPEDG